MGPAPLDVTTRYYMITTSVGLPSLKNSATAVTITNCELFGFSVPGRLFPLRLCRSYRKVGYSKGMQRVAQTRIKCMTLWLSGNPVGL